MENLGRIPARYCANRHNDCIREFKLFGETLAFSPHSQRDVLNIAFVYVLLSSSNATLPNPNGRVRRSTFSCPVVTLFTYPSPRAMSEQLSF